MNLRVACAKTLFGLGMAAVCSLAMAQNSLPIRNGVLHFTCNIGAFKLFNGDGTVKFHFKGTVLVREYQGNLSVTGDVRKEYDSHNRVAYFGDGDIAFTGHFNALQWFGTDLSGEWDGRGGFRVYGDYDKDLNTGWFWYDNDAKKTAWPTQSSNMTLPRPNFRSNTPVLRKS